MVEDAEKNYTNINSQLTDLINPENITTIATAISSGVAITTAVISGIKLWVEDRKNRKIKFKSGDHEFEVSGFCSKKDIEEKLQIFRRYVEENNNHNTSVAIYDEHGVNKVL